MRIYVVLDVKHDEGPRIHAVDLIDLLETDGVNESVEDGDSVYTIEFLGAGKTVADMQESMKLRARR